ncbi:MAG TPA: recombinase family protein [Phenylobacterium sp.]|jgi:DNA invertase Pin-like site-specific DNA recombinase|nr:recombinase family protein [Phenylobacterium sp.]
MSLIGYARVSSAGQSLEVQEEQLTAAGCTKVFAEKRSGTTREGREQLDLALGYVREGDVLVVTRLDRLARSLVDLRKITDGLTAKGVGFRVLHQGSIDTTKSDGRLMLNILASFAEWELDIRKERQMDGIAKAKAAKVYKGRPATLDGDEVRRLHAEGMRPAHIAKRLGVARSSVYRLLTVRE